MKFAKLIIEEEVAGDNSIITDLRNQGFTVEPNDEGSNLYTVRKNGQSALLDLSTQDSMTSSLQTIQAAFKPNPNPTVGSEEDADYDIGQDYPMMGQGTDHKLAQRVAAIGEDAKYGDSERMNNKIKLPVQATSMQGGKTYHHDVYLFKPNEAVAKMQKMVKMISQNPEFTVKIANTPCHMYLSDFLKGGGPLTLDYKSGWKLVNADEIRDFIADNLMGGDWMDDAMNAYLDSIDRPDTGNLPESKNGLWYNIAQKKKRMGKNYKPAKPGEKGRPETKAYKNASKS